MSRPAAPSRPTAFTLIELLVVIGIIGLLVSIVLVAGSGALSSSKRLQTERFLRNLANGLEQFKTDHGYYPPLLNPPLGASPGQPIRAIVVTEAAQNAYAPDTGDLERKRYYSVHSLSAYLVGVGDLNYDGKESYDPVNGVAINLDDGVSGPGFHSPGADQSWGGSRTRNGTNTGLPEPGKAIPEQTGRTFGPYIDIAQGKGLRAASEDQFHHDELGDQEHANKGMYYLVDRWDKPIRYYRDWPTKSRGGANAGKDTLEEAPLELLNPDAAAAFGTANPVDPSTDKALLGAPFALLSAGEDGMFGESENEGRSGANPVLAKNFHTAVADEAARKKMVVRMKDNVRITP